MSENELNKNYTLQELLDELDVIEAFEDSGSTLCWRGYEEARAIV